MKNISLYLVIAALLGACASEPTKTQTGAKSNATVHTPNGRYKALATARI